MRPVPSAARPVPRRSGLPLLGTGYTTDSILTTGAGPGRGRHRLGAADTPAPGPCRAIGRARRQLLRATAAALALTPVLLALTPALAALALGRFPAA